jgi:cysteine-rich repeat protein
VGVSRLFYYRDVTTGTLSLFSIQGIDFDTSGVQQPQANVKLDLTGLPVVTIVSVADDTLSEFNKSSATTAFGAFTFTNNTDGGVISGFPFPGSWQVVVAGSFTAGIKLWLFDGVTSLQTISPGGTAKVLLRAYDSPSKCRLDCTIPKCGDGRLDGGEICDDKNIFGGDGCSADCKSLK